MSGSNGKTKIERPEYFTVTEAAEYLRLAVGAIRRMIWSRQVPVCKQGKNYILSRVDLDAWFERTKATL